MFHIENFKWKEIEERKERWYIFINAEFVLFRGESRKTVADMAREIGVSQGLLTQWMQKDGKIPRSQDSINKLVVYFGDVIYDVLGLFRPADPADEFPRLLREVGAEYTTKVKDLGLSVDSPEAESILDEIMKARGYNKIETNSPTSLQ